MLKIIISEGLKKTLGNDQEGTPHTEVRYLPEEVMNPAVVNVYGDSVLTVLWTEVPIAFLMRSAGVAETFRNYFKLLWKQAKR